jgi:hypothetical protein
MEINSYQTFEATPNQDPAIRNYLEQLQQEVRQIRSNQIAQAHQPATGQESCAQNCLTGTLFTIIGWLVEQNLNS